MPTTHQPPTTEPLRASLSDADDCIRLNHWMTPQQGIAPRIRIGRRWINTLWGLPIGAAALLCLIALAQSLRELPGVQAFIQEYPGIAQSAPSVDSGFPWWLQLQHFLNMFFMLFIMRAGLQILADHPVRSRIWRADGLKLVRRQRFARKQHLGAAIEIYPRRVAGDDYACNRDRGTGPGKAWHTPDPALHGSRSGVDGCAAFRINRNVDQE